MSEPLSPFDPAELLTSDEAMRLFLAEAKASGDGGYLAHAFVTLLRAAGSAERVAGLCSFSARWSEEDGEHVELCAEFPSLSCLATDQAVALKGIQELVTGVLAEHALYQVGIASGESVPMSEGDWASLRGVSDSAAEPNG